MVQAHLQMTFHDGHALGDRSINFADPSWLDRVDIELSTLSLSCPSYSHQTFRLQLSNNLARQACTTATANPARPKAVQHIGLQKCKPRCLQFLCRAKTQSHDAGKVRNTFWPIKRAIPEKTTNILVKRWRSIKI